MHKTLYIFPILVKTTLFFPMLRAPAPFPNRSVRALDRFTGEGGGGGVEGVGDMEGCVHCGASFMVGQVYRGRGGGART